ncbi:hypothetical protein Sme01_61980 [Sphaerisporangium melleum]|uniref:Uncharacterized protein n=1 Tax=Sphaerisporangium melleum TaxID=321316 RepID=A0A917VNC6_9ACTN|nr:hypothetical protein GCM10007964_45600 [Sphaerisporangium melleum]GII73722.1 hypothetical protein Sme01_61980 [Sphaerisporangium melleum]
MSRSRSVLPEVDAEGRPVDADERPCSEVASEARSLSVRESAPAPERVAVPEEERPVSDREDEPEGESLERGHEDTPDARSDSDRDEVSAAPGSGRVAGEPPGRASGTVRDEAGSARAAEEAPGSERVAEDVPDSERAAEESPGSERVAVGSGRGEAVVAERPEVGGAEGLKPSGRQVVQAVKPSSRASS